MAKSKKTRASKASQKAPDTTPEANGWSEIGDVWDDMFLFENPGDTFEGVYTRTAHEIGPNSSQVHIFEKANVKTGIWGSAALDQRMRGAKPGYLTRVIYESLALSPKSGREYKDFKVYQQADPAPGYAAVTDDDIPF